MQANTWERQTVVAESSWAWVLVWVGFPAIGALAGLAVEPVLRWLTSLPLAPMQGPFRLVEEIAGARLTLGAVAVGAVAGLLLAWAGSIERLTVTVSDVGVVLRRNGKDREFDRAAVTAVFRDGKQLVLQGRLTEDLARDPNDLDTPRLAEAFRAHGFPWRDEDPYRSDFHLWVPDTPQLPAGADAVLAARARALDKGNKEDLAALRAELGKLGVVVRDEKKRQHWRSTRQT